MHAIKIVKNLGPIDARLVRRDSLLPWMAGLPILVALAARSILPIVLARVGALVQFDLLALYPVIMSYALLALTPIICGQVIGFLLLDQRDDGTLTALQVTPLPLTSYLAYRLAAPMAVSLAMTLAAFPIAGLVEIGILQLLLAALAAAPLAPLFALALVWFAANKVQGFALMKASSILLIAPAIAYFIRSGWQLAFGLVPTYWPAKLYWALLNGEPGAWIYLLAGLVYQALLLLALLRRFDRVLHQ